MVNKSSFKILYLLFLLDIFQTAEQDGAAMRGVGLGWEMRWDESKLADSTEQSFLKSYDWLTIRSKTHQSSLTGMFYISQKKQTKKIFNIGGTEHYTTTKENKNKLNIQYSYCNPPYFKNNV